jgi:hypothetical protein
MYGSCSAFRVSGTQNIAELFFMLRWDRYVFYKKRIGKRYTKLVFFYAVGSASHILHSSVFGTSNIDALFFMIM